MGRTHSADLDPDDPIRSRLAAAAIRWSPGTEVSHVSTVSRGSSSLTYAAVLNHGLHEEHCFVKVAPPGLEPVRNRDVLRQASMMRLLAEEGTVAVPSVLFIDPGAPPEVPPFFVNAAVRGDCVEPLIDEDSALPPSAVLTNRAAAAVRMLAHLHNVDPRKAASLPAGAPNTDLNAEVDRWARIFATVDPALAAAGTLCAEVLRAHLPEAMPPAIIHGDFRLGNLICMEEEVRAVLDWEIWSVSDPRIDLSWFLMTLSSEGLPSAVRDSAPGLPTPRDMLAEYEDARGMVLADMTWFDALSRFRAAAAMSLNVKHNRRRKVPEPRIERYAAILPQFLAVATSLLE